MRRQAKLKLKKMREDKELAQKDVDTLEVSWRVCKMLSDEVGTGGYASALAGDDAGLARLVRKYRSERKKRAELGNSIGLTETDMAVIDKQLGILFFPKTSEELLTDLTVNANYVGLDIFVQAFGGTEFNLEALESTVSRGGPSPSHSEIVRIDDNFSTASIRPTGLFSELTYAITVNHDLNRLTVVFRGSTALNDWVTNINASATDFKLPGPNVKSGTTYGKVHERFYEYLYSETSAGKNGRTISKAEDIMGTLHELFKKYPYYTLWVTGHSLGGALSTLFSFRAAIDGGIPNKPVMNVTFASPFVGDAVFQKEFQELERDGWIRHLRVSNEDDVVPLIPFSSNDLIPTPFKHVGMHVRLYEKTLWRWYTSKISYPKVDGNLLDEFGRAISNNLFLGLTYKLLPNHMCPEYRSRLDAAKEDLQETNLESLYRDKFYVGALHRS